MFFFAVENSMHWPESSPIFRFVSVVAGGGDLVSYRLLSLAIVDGCCFCLRLLFLLLVVGGGCCWWLLFLLLLTKEHAFWQRKTISYFFFLF